MKVTKKKLHVFIVLMCNSKNECRVLDIYPTRNSAQARLIRYQDAPCLAGFTQHRPATFHIIKKSVNGVMYSFTSYDTKKDFYEVNKKGDKKIW